MLKCRYLKKSVSQLKSKGRCTGGVGGGMADSTGDIEGSNPLVATQICLIINKRNIGLHTDIIELLHWFMPRFCWSATLFYDFSEICTVGAGLRDSSRALKHNGVAYERTTLQRCQNARSTCVTISFPFQPTIVPHLPILMRAHMIRRIQDDTCGYLCISTLFLYVSFRNS